MRPACFRIARTPARMRARSVKVKSSDKKQSETKETASDTAMLEQQKKPELAQA